MGDIIGFGNTVRSSNHTALVTAIDGPPSAPVKIWGFNSGIDLYGTRGGCNEVELSFFVGLMDHPTEKFSRYTDIRVSQ